MLNRKEEVLNAIDGPGNVYSAGWSIYSDDDG
jgi:hypothetical protein